MNGSPPMTHSAAVSSALCDDVCVKLLPMLLEVLGPRDLSLARWSLTVLNPELQGLTSDEMTTLLLGQFTFLVCLMVTWPGK